MYDLNPLDVLKQREVKTLPPHFIKCKLSDVLFVENDIRDWVRAKLKGRFCIVSTPSLSSKGQLMSATVIGFEDQKELTYFMLACPYMRRN
jgi:hypothetical protein